MHGLTASQGRQLKAALQGAQQTGLSPNHFNPALVQFLGPAARASDRGYIAAYLSVTVVALIGVMVVARLVLLPAATVTGATGTAGTAGATGATGTNVTEVEVDEHR